MTEAGDSILVDSRTMIWLHAKSRSSLLKLLLTRLDIYVSALSVYEVVAAFIYYRIGDPRTHLASLEKIYHIVYPDREVISTAARIAADLMSHGEPRSDVDVMVAATGITRNIPLATVDPQSYEVFKKYGLSVASLEKMVKRLEAGVGKGAVASE